MPLYKTHPFHKDEDYRALMRFFYAALLGLAMLLGLFALPSWALNRSVFIALNNETYQQWSASGQWFWNTFWRLITEMGDVHVMLWLMVWLMLPKWLHPTTPRADKQLILCGFSVLLLGAGLLAQSMKQVVAALRPMSLLPQELIHVIGAPLYHNSFPSGHTVTAFATAAALCPLLTRSGRMVVFALATLIGLSRISVGAHWPVDVLAGAFIGILTAMGCWQLLFRWQAPNTSANMLTALSRFGLGLLGLNVLYTPFYAAQQPMLWLTFVVVATILVGWVSRKAA